MRIMVCLLILLALFGSVVGDFSGLYGPYITGAASLQTCRTASSCLSYCCILNITVGGPYNKDYEKASLDIYFDPLTISRCGASPNGHYIPISGEVGIATETSSILATTIATMMISTPLQLFINKDSTPSAVILQGSDPNPCIQEALLVPSPSSAHSFCPYISIIIIHILLAWIIVV